MKLSNGYMEYAVFPEWKLFLELFFGELDIDFLKTSSKAIWSEPSYDPSFSGLIDIRNATLKFGVMNVLQMVKFFSDEPKTAKGLLVVVASEYRSTALSSAFARNMASLMKVAVVSTLEGAAQALELDYHRLVSMLDLPRKKLYKST
ncbi:MAG: hypothetical protein Kow0075_04130 [Salibacteraceae bacterium]